MQPVRSPSNFATGMLVEEQSFTWTIDNYPVIRLHKSTINSQKIHFTAGSRLRYPTKWKLYLEKTWIDERRWIGIWLKLRSRTVTPAVFKSWYSEIRFTIKNEEGLIIKDHGILLSPYPVIRPYQYRTKFIGSLWRGNDKFIDAEDDSVISPEGSLVIQITFKLYSPSHYQLKPEPTSSLEAITKKFQVMFSDKLRKDLAGLLNKPVPSSDIKIVSNDKKEFTMQRAILAVRSEIFEAMLSSDMIEANSGVINLPDISSRALQVLLSFLCTGGLDPDWNHPEVLVELTNAAGKYQLLDLLKFLDATLGKVCKVENVLELFTLAHQLSLKTAEVELSKYISVHSISPENCSKMSFPGLDGSVHSLPKRNSRFWTILSSPVKGMFAKN